jgi:hypothetical protein
MASTWLPLWLERYIGTKFKWQERFAWWPVYSHESKKRIWFKKAWYGHRWVEGPAGEEPVKIERWLTADEYSWYCLTNA